MPSVDHDRIQHLVELRDALGLGDYLQSTSNLPGPRGNLEVAAAVATALAGADREWAIDTIEIWSDLGPDRAGGNEPGVMLPFAAAQTAGALWQHSSEEQRIRLDAILHRSANDSRWRVREGVAMGFQRIGFDNFSALQRLVERWEPDATLLEYRAIVAGLAEPPLLATSENAGFGTWHAMTAFHALLAVPVAARRDDDAQALRKALGYALSVFIAVDPVGFEQLEEVARTPDKDAVWIARENLKKARIAKKYPAECMRIAGALAS